MSVSLWSESIKLSKKYDTPYAYSIPGINTALPLPLNIFSLLRVNFPKEPTSHFKDQNLTINRISHHKLALGIKLKEIHGSRIAL